MEDPPKKFFRLSIGTEVRLIHAYYITCNEIIKNDNNQIIELRCTYDPKSFGGWSEDGRKVRGTLHWVSKKHAIDGTLRLYDKLFNVENPLGDESGDYLNHLNSDSIQTINNVKMESSLQNIKLDVRYQFLRKGYFIKDKSSKANNLIFNQIVGLRDTWTKKNIK